MVRAVKGMYEDVYVVFPEVERLRSTGIPARAFRRVDGIVSLGGHALEDSERLWEEDLRAPSHA